MSYIGNTPAENYASFLTETFSVSATVNYTLSHAVSNENDIRLVINGVVQQPGSGKAYTASNTTLTLTSATSSGDSMYAVYLGRALQTVNPPNASVGTAQLADSSVTSAKLASGAVANTPAFEAFRSSAQSINDNTYTKIQFNAEVYDTNNCYDSSSNYRFTPTTAGKYFVYSYVLMDTSAGNMRQISTRIYKNGNQGGGTFANINFDNTNGEGGAQFNHSVIDFNGSSDYVEIFANPDTVDNAAASVEGDSGERYTVFGAYRIIGA